jgi:hypothetical protein
MRKATATSIKRFRPKRAIPRLPGKNPCATCKAATATNAAERKITTEPGRVVLLVGSEMVGTRRL